MKKNLPSVDGIKYAWNPRFYNKGWSMDETLKKHMLVGDAERNTDRWVMQKKKYSQSRNREIIGSTYCIGTNKGYCLNSLIITYVVDNILIR
jgi:hypothetical protein